MPVPSPFRPPIGRAPFVLLLFAALVLGSVTTPPVDAATRLLIHAHPVRARAAAHPAAPAEPITFHGGAVMTGAVHVYIVWYGGWSPRSNRRRIVTDFLRNLPSPYWDINRGYPNATGKVVTSTPELSAQIEDPGSVGTKDLSDADIQRVVEAAIAAKALPRDSRGIYLVLTSSKVTKTGFLTEYCGWHSYARIAGSIIKFAFIGDPTGPRLGGCGATSRTPNGDPGADSMVSTIAHELAETVTDPTFRGWRTAGGEENADRCAFRFGTQYLTRRGPANVHLGARDYLLQTNWVNSATPHCGLAP